MYIYLPSLYSAPIAFLKSLLLKPWKYDDTSSGGLLSPTGMLLLGDPSIKIWMMVEMMMIVIMIRVIEVDADQQIYK